MTGKILVVSGASGVGKSTLARTLLSFTSGNWLYLEADAMAPTIGPSSGNPGFERDRFVDALIDSALAWPRAGYNTIIDGVLPYPEDEVFQACVAKLRNVGARFLAVTAPPESVQARIRLRERGDEEWAIQQLKDINMTLDAEYDVDTTAPVHRDDVIPLISWMNAQDAPVH